VTQKQQDWIAERFETHRPNLRRVAYRMLGSASEAEDAVQEAWLRLARSDADAVANLGGWLTTVVARVCLDMLRSRKSRREEALGADVPEPTETPEPDAERQLADSVSLAMLVVLETLSPAERVAFVLHDMFDLPFDEIAPIVDRTPAAARQLASRARRRVQGARTSGDIDREKKRDIVAAFLAASHAGDFTALLALLDPNVVMRADMTAVRSAAANVARGAPQLSAETHGAEKVADTFAGRARAARLALVDGDIGLAFALGGQTRGAFVFTVADGRITDIEIVADPERVAHLNVAFLPA
jgi:RNA polymerase sigma factor (sigma-70 family)